MKKVVGSIEEALAGIEDGMTIMAGGFGLSGNPNDLIEGLLAKGTKGLTVVSNNCGTTDRGLGVLLKTRQIRKMISSYVGENKELERQFLAGELEVELNPQGTLAERIRAGAFGLGGFFTPTGVGTQIAEGKETRTIDGREYVFEKPLKGDFAIVHAWKADELGNVVFRKTARNFSPLMCMAAKVTIVEAEEIVKPGTIDGDHVHVPSVFVKRILQASKREKWIENRTVRPRA